MRRPTSRVAVASALVVALSGCANLLGFEDLHERDGSGVDAADDDVDGGASDLSLTPSSHAFPPVVANSPGVRQTFTLTNGGAQASGAITVSLTGADAGGYMLANDTCTNDDLPPNDTCIFDVVFAPTTIAAYNDAAVSVSASGGDSVMAALTGTGVSQANLVIEPVFVQFGDGVIGTTGTPVTLLVQNRGGVATTALAAAQLTGVDAAEFTITDDQCQSMTLVPAGLCTIKVAFRPTTGGAKEAALTVSATVGGSFSAPLAGQGLLPGDLTIDRVNNDYGSRAIGSASSEVAFVVRNNGTAATGMLEVTLSDAASFSITANGCAGVMLAPTSTCTLQVTFDPDSVGGKIGTLTINGSPGGAVAASLAGVGTARLTVVRAGLGIGTVTSSPAGIVCGGDCLEDYVIGSVTLTASPDSTAMFSGWSGGGCIGTDPCLVTMDAAKTVTATFEPLPRSLNVMVAGAGAGTVTSAPPGIACPGDCAEDVGSGTTVTLTAAADTNSSTFAGWGGACSGMAASCAVTVNGLTNVTATFDLRRFMLSVLRTGNGSGTVTSDDPAGIIDCGSDCSELVEHGTSVTLRATASAGSTFTGWLGACSGNTPTCTTTVIAAANVTAEFTLDQHPLTVTRNGLGTGTVTSTMPSGIIDCGGDCSETVGYGTMVTLTAAPAAGSTFGGWGGACSGTGTCTVTVTAASTVSATFDLTTVALVVSKNGSGMGTITSDTPANIITCGADCSENVNYGTVVTLRAAPMAGSNFTSWGGDCSGTAATCTVTVQAATTVTATFTLANQSLTVAKAGNGAGTITSTSPAGIINCGTDCSENVTFGTTVTLSASPAAGSTFTGWSGGGCSGTSTCTSTINAATTITATFTLTTPTLTVNKTGSNGTGTITSTPAGISCATGCATASANFNYGTSVTLTPAAGTGSTFTRWEGSCTGSTTCTVSMTQARTVTAVFTLTQHVLTVSKAGNATGTVMSSSPDTQISCGTACASDTGTYNYGTMVSLTASPGTGATFAGWSGGGCTGTGACTTTVTGMSTVTATFNLIPVTLTLMKAGNGSGTVTSSSPDTQISCGTSCTSDTGTYNYGSSVTLATPTPGTGSVFAGWSGGGCSGTTTCTVTLTANTTVMATFNLTTPTLTVNKTGSNGTGTIASTPAGISCATGCSTASANFNYGTSVSLSATPGTGSMFSNWAGSCTGTGACSVSMTTARTVTAVFTLIPYVLTLNKAGTGSGTVTSSPTGISCGTTCSSDTGTYNYGTMVTLTAAPATGSDFVSWSGGGCSGSNLTCVTTVTAAATVTATFNLKQITITVAKPASNTGNGSLSSTPTGITCGTTCTSDTAVWAYGTSVVLSQSPDSSSDFTGWSGVTCSPEGAGSRTTCTFTVPAQNTTINAGFMQPWDRLVDGTFTNGDDRATGVATDPSSNILVAGLQSVGPNVGVDENGWLGKYSPSNTQTWTSTYNNATGNGSDVFRGVAANSTHVFAVGYSYTNATDGRDMIIRRYTSAGSGETPIFVAGAGAPQDVATDVVIGPGGYVHVSGQLTVSGQGANCWLGKYTSTLTPVWSRNYNGGSNLNDVCFGVAVDSTGNSYVVGWETTTTQGTNIIVRKYDLNGNLIWNAVHDQAGLDDFAYDVAVDSAGDVYVIGSVRLTSTNQDGWIRKYTSAGATSWTVTTTAGANAEGRGIATCNGYVYATGYYDAAGQDQNIWMKRLTTAGAAPASGWIADRVHNGSSNLQDWGWGVACDGSNNVIFSGWVDYGANAKAWIRKYYQ